MPSRSGNSPIEIAHRVYWVGHYLSDDRFQCHAYLIEHGDQSVLFDPGSALTFPHTLSKIEQVVPISKIRYFVCHHQDPDITGAMALIDQITPRSDAVIVTHWRAVVLLRHLGLKMPFWEVSEHDWTLDLGGRVLEFVFTPYLHFPGAITTFDRQTGTLFSSDLFGGFTDGDELIAADMQVAEGIRAFHEHYMPSHEVLLSGMLRLERLPLELIAPQHGSIIPKPLIQPIIDELKRLECGLFQLTERDSRVERLMQLSETLRAMLRTLHLEKELRTIAGELLRLTQKIVPVSQLEFLVRDGDGYLILGPENRYHGSGIQPEPSLVEAFGLCRDDFTNRELLKLAVDRIALPLFSSGTARVEGFAILTFAAAQAVDAELGRVLTQIAEPLGVAIEREGLLRQLERERDEISALASRDPLTELYTRRHMNDVVTRLVALHDRDHRASFAVLLFDIDHFKRVNDTYGHPAGDAILKAVAACVRGTIRASDVAVRYGGEEILVLADVSAIDQALVLAERIRVSVKAHSHPIAASSLNVSISVGVALRRQAEPFPDCLARADEALYRAKQGGRNRVCAAD